MKRLLTLAVFVLGFLLLGSWALAWADGTEALTMTGTSSTLVVVPGGATMAALPVLSTPGATPDSLEWGPSPLAVPDVLLPGLPLPVPPEADQPAGVLDPSGPVPVLTSGTDATDRDDGVAEDEAGPAAGSSGQESAVVAASDLVGAAGTVTDTSGEQFAAPAPSAAPGAPDGSASAPAPAAVAAQTGAIGLTVTTTVPPDTADKSVVVTDQAGQAEVTYVYYVTNLSDQPLDQVSVVDRLLGTIPLATTHLAPRGSVVGRASYKVTPADVARGVIVNHAVAQGTTSGGQAVSSQPIERTVMVVGPSPAPGSAPVLPQPQPQVLGQTLLTQPGDQLTSSPLQGPLPRTGPATGMGTRVLAAGMLWGAGLVLARRLRRPRHSACR